MADGHVAVDHHLGLVGDDGLGHLGKDDRVLRHRALRRRWNRSRSARTRARARGNSCRRRRCCGAAAGSALRASPATAGSGDSVRGRPAPLRSISASTPDAARSTGRSNGATVLVVEIDQPDPSFAGDRECRDPHPRSSLNLFCANFDCTFFETISRSTMLAMVPRKPDSLPLSIKCDEFDERYRLDVARSCGDRVGTAHCNEALPRTADVTIGSILVQIGIEPNAAAGRKRYRRSAEEAHRRRRMDRARPHAAGARPGRRVRRRRATRCAARSACSKRAARSCARSAAARFWPPPTATR